MKTENRFCHWFRQACRPLLGCIAFSMCVASCTDESELSEGVGQYSNTIAFNVTAQGEGQSRSAETDSLVIVPIAEEDSLMLLAETTSEFIGKEPDAAISRGTIKTSFSEFTSFKVLGYEYADPWDEKKTSTYHLTVSPSVTDASVWKPATTKVWPGSAKRVKFFAYAPASAINLTVPANSVTGTPTLKYTVPPTITSQQDLCAAVADYKGDSYIVAPLEFNHLLTAVKFTIAGGAVKGTVKSVKLKGVYKSGTYTFGSHEWALDKKTGDFTLDLRTGVEITGNSDVCITTGSNVFLMMPQILPEGAQIELSYLVTSTGQTKILTADISNQYWPMGRTVNYRISPNSADIEYTFMVNGGNSTFTFSKDYEATSDKMPIVSQGNKGGLSLNASWTAVTVDSAGNVIPCPGWFTDIMGGIGGSSNAAIDVSAAAIPAVVEESLGTLELQRAAEVGTDNNPVDLSNGKRNTANCYVVNAPGWYKFPVVYGNGYKNGQANNDAYTSELGSFVDYNGHIIDSKGLPDISGGDHASLVWMDEKRLVSDVSLNKNYISFYVDKDNIRQGNALIALYPAYGQDAMWSWHIWVTEWQNEVISYENGKFSLMTKNIGWCDGRKITYGKRSVNVRFTQKYSNKTATVTFIQKGDVIEYRDNCTYYQWGRKDPMPPFLENEVAGGKTLYPTEGAAIRFEKKELVADQINMSTYIKHPNWFYHYANGEQENANQPAFWHTDLWNSGSKERVTYDDVDDKHKHVTVKKTIYDPSPVGYKVLPYGAYYAFTRVSSMSDDGYDVWCSSSQIEKFYFPNKVGQRQYGSGNPFYSSEWWSATLCKRTDKSNKSFGNSFAGGFTDEYGRDWTNNEGYLTTGKPMRSVRE